MIEVKGNLWTYPADVRVITTNGTVKRNGEAVMGRGCALEAKELYDGVAAYLGKCIREEGNKVHFLFGRGVNGPDDVGLISFPVKHQWHEKADLKLIRTSALQLVELMNFNSHKIIVMPKPGCGNGKLKWADVKAVLEPILDNRFHVITFEAKP